MFDETFAQILDAPAEACTGFQLTEADVAGIEYILSSFYAAARTFSTRAAPMRPDAVSLVRRAADGDGRRRAWRAAYLASEENYRAVARLQQNNLIVPLVGNFAGPKTLRAIGAWVQARGAKVTTFYTSNVEQYLFQDRIWDAFAANVASLPLDETSTFIRSCFNSCISTSSSSRVVMLLDSLPGLVQDASVRPDPQLLRRPCRDGGRSRLTMSARGRRGRPDSGRRGAVASSRPRIRSSQAVPESAPCRRLSDAQFWKLSTDLSEPAGSFRSENLVSNEHTYQYVHPGASRSRSRPGGVYLGVAPDQNFTYIAAVRPRIAFIVDIRRGNLLQHLMYKAVFELSADRGGVRLAPVLEAAAGRPQADDVGGGVVRRVRARQRRAKRSTGRTSAAIDRAS